MTIPATATYEVGQVLYRAEVYHDNKITYVKCHVDALTAKGCWVKPAFFVVAILIEAAEKELESP